MAVMITMLPRFVARCFQTYRTSLPARARFHSYEVPFTTYRTSPQHSRTLLLNGQTLLVGDLRASIATSQLIRKSLREECKTDGLRR
eukprot:scaffold621083_cov25-Prasinocladus_malaysianus.AAC.1